MKHIKKLLLLFLSVAVTFSTCPDIVLAKTQQTTSPKASVREGEYYPEVQCGYIDYEGVKWAYEDGLDITQKTQAGSSILFAATPNIGTFLAVVGIYSSLRIRKTSLEYALEKAYYSKKEIKVYYQQHKSVQSLSKVRYVIN